MTKIDHIEAPCTTACYGMQANFVSIRFIGEFPEKQIPIWCRGAIPNTEFKCHYPMIEWQVDPGDPELYTSTLKCGGKHDSQNVLSMRIMAAPGFSQRKDFQIGSGDKSIDLTLLNGSGFPDIEVGIIDLGEVAIGSRGVISVPVKNVGPKDVVVTRVEFSSNNIHCEDLQGSINIARGQTVQVEFRYHIRSRYDVNDLNFKVWYEIDVDEQEYAVVKAKSSYVIGSISKLIDIKTGKFTDFEDQECAPVVFSGSENNIYLGNTANSHYGKQVNIGLKFDNNSDADVVVSDLKYSSSVDDIRVSFESKDIEVLSGEAKSLKINVLNNGSSSYGIGILTFTTREIKTGIPGTFRENHKLFLSWGRNK